MKARALMLGN